MSSHHAHAPRPSVDTIFADVPLRPASVGETLEALETISARLWRYRDPRAVFPDVYGAITRSVREQVARGAHGVFLEPAWISRLTGLFAERYHLALRDSLAGRPVPSGAWRLAFDLAARGLTLPSHDASLGISAHINFDLAQGICDNIVEHGHARDARMLARYRHDHDAVNGLLRAAIPACLARITDRYGCRSTSLLLAHPASRAACERAILATLGSWRDRVWREMLALLEAPTPAHRAAVLRRTDRYSTALGVALCPIGAVAAAADPVLPTAARRRVVSLGDALRATRAGAASPLGPVVALVPPPSHAGAAHRSAAQHAARA